MSVFDWKQGVRYRQGLDGHSYGGAYAVVTQPGSLSGRLQRTRTEPSALSDVRFSETAGHVIKRFHDNPQSG